MFGRTVFLFTLVGLCDSLFALARRFNETSQTLGLVWNALLPEILAPDREGF